MMCVKQTNARGRNRETKWPQGHNRCARCRLTHVNMRADIGATLNMNGRRWRGDVQTSARDAMNDHTRPFKPGEHKPVYPGLEDDPYALRSKLSEPSVCPTCGAVYHDGRWQWLTRPEHAKEVVCTACHRIADRVPAGYVHIEGAFAADHRKEVLELVNHHAARRRRDHAPAGDRRAGHGLRAGRPRRAHALRHGGAGAGDAGRQSTLHQWACATGTMTAGARADRHGDARTAADQFLASISTSG